MIDLFGPLDYATILRRIFGTRGAIRPVGAETIQPVTDVSIDRPSPFGVKKRLTYAVAFSLGAGANLRRGFLTPDIPGSVSVVQQVFVSCQDSFTVAVEKTALGAAPVLDGAAFFTDTSTPGFPQVPFIPFSNPTTAFVTALFGTRRGAGLNPPPVYLHDLEWTLFRGECLTFNVTNNGAGGAEVWLHAELDYYPAELFR